MSRTCQKCGKGTTSGNNVPRKGLPRKKGGGGVKIGVKTKRKFKVNIQTKNTIENGIKKRIRLCTRCLRTMYKEKV